MKMYGRYYESAVGTFFIEADLEGITGVCYIQDLKTHMPQMLNEDPVADKWIEMAIVQLEEYFSGKRKSFDVPVHMQGTEFQCSVWNALQTIPYGETKSYKQIAEQIGNPKAARAVGRANNRNRILILVPCHRVIGSDGALVGFGCGLELKKVLLDLEK